jgi:hypothetical protein
MSLCLHCEMPTHSGGCDREVLKDVIRRLRMERDAGKKMAGGDTSIILITSLISHRNQQPRVDIQLGELHTQMDAAAAVQIAQQLLEVAAGAYADAFIFNFVTAKLNQEQNVGAAIISDFREYRETLVDEFRKMQDQDESSK